MEPVYARIRALFDLATAAKAIPREGVLIVDEISTYVGRRVCLEEWELWLAGESVPNESERSAVATALGFSGQLEYLTSDDPAVHGPIHSQVQALLALAKNNTGLVALRSLSKPLSEDALAELVRLAS